MARALTLANNGRLCHLVPDAAAVPAAVVPAAEALGAEAAPGQGALGWGGAVLPATWQPGQLLMAATPALPWRTRPLRLPWRRSLPGFPQAQGATHGVRPGRCPPAGAR